MPSLAAQFELDFVAGTVRAERSVRNALLELEEDDRAMTQAAALAAASS